MPKKTLGLCMELNALTSLSPIDGRYRDKTKSLAPFFSEFGLIHYRVYIEVEYFIALAEIGIPQLPKFSEDQKKALRNIVINFNEADAILIKEIEKTTNHDVKAVEYFLKKEMSKIGIEELVEFIHFGLTSQDVNNTAIPLSLKEATYKVLLPELENLIQLLSDFANEWKEIPMLAHTHGQPASPTRLGKEIMVFVERLLRQLVDLQSVSYSSKFGGATGNFNAHHVAYPEIDWLKFADNFVNKILGLERSKYTTQIEHYDSIATYCDVWKRINNILIDLSRDIWTYVSMEYFKQKVKEGEVGSSAMPHKVNPIDFENAEGNLGVANSLFEHFASKLPISRLQRDLTDSTVLRNLGVPLAHTLISLQSLSRGLNKLSLNQKAIDFDLNKNWAVVAEAIQTILRREKYPMPYEKLKELTRGKSEITRDDIHNFIDSLSVSSSIKEELRAISPFNYTGILF